MKFFTYFIVILGLLTACQVQNNMHNLNFKVLESSQYGAEMPQQQRLITSQDEYSAIHKKVFANMFPAPEMKEIDFTQKNILFLHFGTFNHGGNTFEVDSIQYENTQLNVYMNTTSPGAGQPSLTVMTYPFLMLEIDKPTQPVETIVIKD